MTDLSNFFLTEDDISYVGNDLSRPECIVAMRNGDLYCSDGRGHLMHIAASGTQTKIPSSPLEGAEPNGFARLKDGRFVVADFSRQLVWIIDTDGTPSILLDSIDGKPLGKVNFVLADKWDRLWITISSRKPDLVDAVNSDGSAYVILIPNISQSSPDQLNPRIVTESLDFANECRIDNSGSYLYVAETRLKHIKKFPVLSNGDLGEPVIHGPSDLGGMVDGIALDEMGNLWGTLVGRECIFILTPTGEAHYPLDMVKPEEFRVLDEAVHNRCWESMETMVPTGCSIAPLMTSLTFGGPDLKTVYIGSLMGDRLASFRSPVAGEPMLHW